MDEQTKSVTLDDLASMIKGGFDDVHGDLRKMQSQIDAINYKMATKEALAQVNQEVGRLRSDMIDYIGKQNLEPFPQAL